MVALAADGGAVEDGDVEIGELLPIIGDEVGVGVADFGGRWIHVGAR